MPLLKREPDVFPSDLFQSTVDPGRWWVAHVRSRQEKALARYLQPLEVPYYLPQREKKVRRSGRTFRSFLPLFPGYLFFRGQGRESDAVRRSDFAVRILEVVQQGQLTEELSQLHRLGELGASFFPHAPIDPGQAVRVVDGPFEGYVGVVIRAKSGNRLLVTVSLLRKTVAVELEREHLAPISPRMRGTTDGAPISA